MPQMEILQGHVHVRMLQTEAAEAGMRKYSSRLKTHGNPKIDRFVCPGGGINLRKALILK